jgi:hypothetical protein
MQSPLMPVTEVSIRRAFEKDKTTNLFSFSYGVHFKWRANDGYEEILQLNKIRKLST